MYQTLHCVRLVLLGVILVGTVNPIIARECQCQEKVQSADGQLSAVPVVTFATSSRAANSYGQAVPVPETPDIFLGMAGIGVMMILRRLFRR